jgi:pimeloyl-ACP methyl ester carboxylesterase
MGVLAFDLRAHGESQGERISLDHHGRTDLQGAIDLLQSRGVARDHIGVVGFSLGAVMALMAAPTEPGLAGMVLDSPFTSMEDMVRQEVSRRGSLHRLLFPGMMLMGRALFGIDLSSVHPLEAVGEIECPLLFIHGEEDDMVDPSNSVRLFEAARVGSKELWLVPGSGHVESYLDRPEEYADRVCDFLDRGATTNTKGE